MVFEVLFNILTVPMTFILGLFPDFTAPGTGGVPEAFLYIGGVLYVANGWINVGLLLAGASLMLGVRLALLAVDAALFIYERIPAKAT